jgi:hypothetical protein
VAVPASELAGARLEWERFMPDYVWPQVLVRTPDDSGGWTDTPTLGAAVPCRVAPLGAGRSGSPEEIIAGRMGLVEGWVVTLPVGTALTEADVLLHNGDRPLQVVSVLAPRSYDMATRVLCQEVL